MEPKTTNWCLRKVRKDTSSLEHSWKRNLTGIDGKTQHGLKKNKSGKMCLERPEKADFYYWKIKKNLPAQEFQRECGNAWFRKWTLSGGNCLHCEAPEAKARLWDLNRPRPSAFILNQLEEFPEHIRLVLVFTLNQTFLVVLLFLQRADLPKSTDICLSCFLLL